MCYFLDVLMVNKKNRISPEKHYEILREFVQGMLKGIFGALLANGVEQNFAANQAKFLARGLQEPLNNPFQLREKEPIKYRLGAEHFAMFASLLGNNNHILMSILVRPPYNFTVEESYYEWKWLMKGLDRSFQSKRKSEDQIQIARLKSIKELWDRAVNVTVTVEIDDQISKTVILDQRGDGETNTVLVKRGLQQIAKSIKDDHFRAANTQTFRRPGGG